VSGEATDERPESDSAAFLKLRDGLLAQHEGKFALIHDRELVGVFDSMEAAYGVAVERFGADPVYIGHISSQPKVECAPALYHGLIHARL
jgi:hypothetical protein